LKKDKVAYAFGDNHFQVPFTLLYADLNDFTKVNISEENFPKEFYLTQNYPNPFNSSTVIGYQLPMRGLVTLVIYDALGREVTKLVDEVKQRGIYTVHWNAGKISSGVYFYRLKAGAFIEVKKMLLIQ
jgi:hypothetical protein